MSKSLNQLKYLMKVVRQPRTIVGLILIQINRAQAIPKPIKQAFVIITASHILTMLPAVMYDLWPKFSVKEADPFLSPWFKKKVEIVWIFKDWTDDVLQVATWYAFGKIALQYSIAMFLICVIYLGYHMIDMLFYFWNFKLSHMLYYDLLWYAIILNKLAISPSKADNLAKIRSLF